MRTVWTVDGWSVGKRIFIVMAAGPGCNWRGAEGAIFGAPPRLSFGVVERLMSPLGTQDVNAHEMAV